MFGSLLTIGSALIARNQQKKAAKSIRNANRAAQDEIRQGRDDAIAGLQPFVNLGINASQGLQGLIDNPLQSLGEIDPLVSFVRNEGFTGIEERAAAMGKLGAGTLKDLARFNNNLSSTIVPQLQNQKFNQLLTLLQGGQSAATNQGNFSTGTAGQIGGFGVNAAKTKIDEANATTDALDTIVSQAPQMGDALKFIPGFGG